MDNFTAATILVVSLFLILGTGVWVGLALTGVAWIGMQLLGTNLAGDAMAITIWSTASSWTLTALPMFVLMGEILFRTSVSQDLFRGLAPLLARLPGGLLHTNIVGSALFAAVTGSSAATCTTVGKITLPEMQQRGYPAHMVIGTLTGASTLGIMIPPSIMMIVYAVIAEVSIAKMFMAGIIPGLMLASLFSLYVMMWSTLHPHSIPNDRPTTSWHEILVDFCGLLPVMLLILTILGSIYFGLATATEAASLGVIGALLLSKVKGTLTWRTFIDSLMSATRLYCMIGLILAGASFLSLAMGYMGIPRAVAQWIGSFALDPSELILALLLFYILLGCFLEGISMIVLTMAVVLPIVGAAGIDLIWFGVFVILVVEMAQITPPIGFNLFVMQGLTGRSLGEIALATLPMFVLMLLTVVILLAFPDLVTWLPDSMTTN